MWGGGGVKSYTYKKIKIYFEVTEAQVITVPYKSTNTFSGKELTTYESAHANFI